MADRLTWQCFILLSLDGCLQFDYLNVHVYLRLNNVSDDITCCEDN